jgi:hypothetical protein
MSMRAERPHTEATREPEPHAAVASVAGSVDRFGIQQPNAHGPASTLIPSPRSKSARRYRNSLDRGIPAGEG